MKEVYSSSFEDEVLSKEGVVIVDFFATWCGPCKQLVPVLEAMEEDFPNIKVVKLNIQGAVDIAKEYNIVSIPTLIAFKNGKVVKRQVGASKVALADMFDELS